MGNRGAPRSIKLPIILDTNVLVRDPALNGVLFRQAFDESRAGRFEFVIPKLVIQEAARVLAREAVENIRTMKKSAQALRRLGLSVENPEDSMADEAQMRKHFERQLEARLRDAEARVADFPNVAHQDLVAHLLDGRKPFKEKGGYRDALLWASVIELATKVGTVAFVTENSRDFSATEFKDVLHSDLIRDLKEAGLSSESVEYFQSLEGLVKAHVPPARQALSDVKRLLAEDEDFATEMMSELGKALNLQLPYGSPVDLSPLELGPFSDPTFTYFEETLLRDLEVDDARGDDPKSITLFLSVTTDAAIDVFISKADYYALPADFPLELEDANWNEQTVFGWVTREVRIEFEGAYDSQARQLTQATVSEAIVEWDDFL